MLRREADDVVRKVPPDQGDVLVGVVGGLVVRRGGFECTDAELGSRKARLLLGRLAVEAARRVSVDEVVEALWGDAPPRHPEQNVASLVSRLRAKFGVDLVVGGRSSGYRLGRRVRVDLDDAAELTEC